MDYEAFLEQVRTRAGLNAPDARPAEAVARDTVAALGELLDPAERRELVEDLPPPLASALRQGPAGLRYGPETFFEQVRRRSGAMPGPAREQAQAVLSALAGHLPRERLVWLCARLPDGYVPLLSPPAEPHAPPPPQQAGDFATVPGRGHTLSTGRPGSTRPLSEAPGPAQRDSVAASDDPHADVKLSEARGTAAERRGRTLATGRPGSDKPVSRTR